MSTRALRDPVSSLSLRGGGDLSGSSIPHEGSKSDDSATLWDVTLAGSSSEENVGTRATSDGPSSTSILPQRLGRLNAQRPARRGGARQHSHRGHDDGRDHRRGQEIRCQALGAPREEQDEAVSRDNPSPI